MHLFLIYIGERGHTKSMELTQWIILHQRWCRDYENCPCFRITTKLQETEGLSEGREQKHNLLKSMNRQNYNFELNIEYDEEITQERRENIYLLLRYLMRESLQVEGDNSCIFIFSAYLELFFHKQQRFLALYQITNAGQAKPSYFQKFLIFSFK